jgi:ParB family chromosome partitioning protein
MATATLEKPRRQRPAQTLTEVDREVVIQEALGEDAMFKNEGDFDSLRRELAKFSEKNLAVDFAKSWFQNSAGEFDVDRKTRGDRRIIAKPNGLHVIAGDRRGIVRYIDLVDEVLDFSSTTSNGDAPPVMPERAQNNGGNNLATETPVCSNDVATKNPQQSAWNGLPVEALYVASDRIQVANMSVAGRDLRTKKPWAASMMRERESWYIVEAVTNHGNARVAHLWEAVYKAEFSGRARSSAKGDDLTGLVFDYFQHRYVITGRRLDLWCKIDENGAPKVDSFPAPHPATLVGAAPLEPECTDPQGPSDRIGRPGGRASTRSDADDGTGTAGESPTPGDGTITQPESSPAAGDLRKKRDWKLNSSGVFVRNVKCVKVPIPKSTGCKITIRLVEHKGRWHTGYKFEGPMALIGGASADPAIGRDSYSSREAALLGQLDHALKFLSERDGKKDPRTRRAKEAVREFRAKHIVPPESSADYGKGEKSSVRTKPPSSKKHATKEDWLNREGPPQEVRKVAIEEIQAAVTNREPQTSVLDVAFAFITPNPFQQRKEFDQEELAGLAATIKEHGLIQRVVLRTDPNCSGAYQLVAGERRCRAMKLLGWTHAPAEIRQFTDAQMQVLALVENEQRKDLNPVERGRGFKRLLHEQKFRPVDLEKILGRSQGYISNHLRLLDLPKACLERVAAGEISLTHARSLMPFAKYPALVAAALKIKSIDKMSHSNFEEKVAERIDSATRDVEEDHDRHYRHIGKLKLSESQRQELGIITVRDRWGDFSDRATNTKLFDQLWKAHEAKKSSDDDDEKPSGGKKGEKKLTPTQLKERSKKRSEQFRNRMRAWKANWLRWLIAQRLEKRGAQADDVTMFRVLLFAARRGTSGFGLTNKALFKAIEQITGKKPRSVWNDCGGETWNAVMLAEDGELADIALAFARHLFWAKIDNQEQPIAGLDDREVFSLAKHLKLNLAKEWKANQAGPLTEAFYQLHDTEPLRALCRELRTNGVVTNDSWNQPPEQSRKSEIVAQLLKDKPKKLPQELAAAK